MKIVNQQTLSRGCTERGAAGGVGRLERESDRGERVFELQEFEFVEFSQTDRQSERERERGESDRETEREREKREGGRDVFHLKPHIF